MSLIPCPECTREVSPQALHCPQCGHPLRAAGPAAMPQRRPQSPENGSVSERPRKRWIYYGAVCIAFSVVLTGIENVLQVAGVLRGESALVTLLGVGVFAAAFVMFTLGSFERLKLLPPGPARRPMYVITPLLGLTALLMVLGMLVNTFEQISSSNKRVIHSGAGAWEWRSSDDGLVQIQLPEDWRPSEVLRQHVPTAHLAVSDPSGDINFTVTSFLKSDLSQLSLRQVTTLNREQVVNILTEAVTSDLEDLRVAGCPALRYEATGAFQERRITYVQTIVETPSRFFVISASTRPSLVDSVRSQVATAVASFSSSDR